MYANVNIKVFAKCDLIFSSVPNAISFPFHLYDIYTFCSCDRFL